MDFTIDIPADLFDSEYTREAFGERLRELAILELVRVKRLHEHEAAAMFGIARWELVGRMKAVGIEPTESAFDVLKTRLDNAISRRDVRIKARFGGLIMRLLHTMLRVNNFDESLKFYCDNLGMKLLRKHDFPAGEFTLAFVGYGDEKDATVLEFTYNYGKHSYDIGDAYGHIAIGVDDIYAICADLKRKGVKVTREPGPMKHGSTVIAFIEDPNGYKIELIQR